MVKLNIPYHSQWDATAKKSKNDCGPTSLSMVLSYYLKKEITSDTIFNIINPGSGYVSFQQLQNAALKYDCKSEIKRGSSLDYLKECLDKDIAPIIVVHYGYLPNRQDSFTGPHILVVSGYDSKGFYLHDPNYWSPRRSEGEYKYYTYAEIDKAWNTTVDGNAARTVFVVTNPNPNMANLIELKEDIPSWVEDELDLKSYSWYDKHWTFEDWAKGTEKISKKNKTLETKVDKLEKQVGQLEKQLAEKPVETTLPTETVPVSSEGSDSTAPTTAELISIDDFKLKFFNFLTPELKKSLIDARRTFITAAIAQVIILLPNFESVIELIKQDPEKIWTLFALPVLAAGGKAVLKYVQEKWGKGDYTRWMYKI